MTTKQRITKEALKLFAEKGYSDVYVGDIAQAVGIKAPSLYKHFKSKQEIFHAILDEMRHSYSLQAEALQINGNSESADAAVYAAIDEKALVKIGKGLFLYFLHDEDIRLFRKMLTIEQFHNNDLASLYTKQYFDDPMTYQAGLFMLLTGGGKLRSEETSIMALHFYAPIYMLLTLCDRHSERENEAIAILEAHIRQFNRIYREEKK